MIPRPAADVGRVETKCKLRHAHASRMSVISRHRQYPDQGFQLTGRGLDAAPLSESNIQTGSSLGYGKLGITVFV
jgi:hypothetical protein